MLGFRWGDNFNRHGEIYISLRRQSGNESGEYSTRLLLTRIIKVYFFTSIVAPSIYLLYERTIDSAIFVKAQHITIVEQLESADARITRFPSYAQINTQLHRNIIHIYIYLHTYIYI